MNEHFHLERKDEVISLGVLSSQTFYPTMMNEVFEILVKESRFRIKDESGKEFSLEEFNRKINYSFTNSPPVISLNSSS
ncbi:MAG: hypothetical protein KAT16_09085 [Candidatus Heimdallarchaeota archaeon]|nr:hypothetical protein [Candidatus Heimdallarchaeota archaeon]